jgi:hypothetical protein
MKHQTLLKSFLLLTLIIAFSSVAYASEVIGNISSAGIINAQNTTTSLGGSTTSGGISSSGGISGTVSGGIPPSSTIGGITSSGGGSVKETTISSNPTLAANSSSDGFFSPDGMAFGPSSNNLALGGGTDVTSPIATSSITPTQLSNETATALGAFSNFSFTSWFWIIFLLLLLVVAIVYIYSRQPLNKRKLAKI